MILRPPEDPCLPPPPITGFQPELIAAALESRGLALVHGFLPEPLVAALRSRNDALMAAGELRPARIGPAGGEHLLREVRGDLIRWIDPLAPAPAERDYLRLAEELRLALNRRLFLGLLDFEACHSRFPPGRGYHRHRDRFQHSDLRVLTLVSYLNEAWQPEDGGELRLDLEDGHRLDVLPEAGSAIVFLSDRFPHEVLPTRRERLGISGWFRRRG